MALNNEVNISVVIITYNEEARIAACVESVVGIADEILVVDSLSQDNTREICRNYDVRFIENAFPGYIEQKNYATSLAKYDIILSLDADEVLSEVLKEQIRNVKSNWEADAYAFNRLSSFQGKWIYHCGWYPDRKIRLFNRRKAHWGGFNPHDHIIMDDNTRIQLIKQDILHYPYDSLNEYINKANTFSSIEAQTAFEKGNNSTVLFHVVLKPFYTFIEKFFIRLGILDGYQGFIISIVSSLGKFLKYIKLRELNRR